MDTLKEIFPENIFPEDIENKEEQWIKLEVQLVKKEFYTFNFFSFNIFYAVLMMISCGINIFFLADYFRDNTKRISKVNSFSNETSLDKKNLQGLPDSLKATKFQKDKQIIKDTSIYVEYMPEVKKYSEKTDQNKKNIPSLISSTITIDTVSNKDTIHLNNDHFGNPQQKDSVLKSLKPSVVYIIKRDTIIKIDSIKIGNKKNLRNR